MSPAQIKALRDELRCTTKELAAALSLDGRTVTAWENGDEFPTKRWVEQLEALRARGPSAIVRRKAVRDVPPLALLADPELWRLLRKLLVHKELRAAALKLAESYDDPGDGATK